MVINLPHQLAVQVRVSWTTFFSSCKPTCSRSTVELNWTAGTSIFNQSSFCPRLSSRASSQRALILNLFVACISTCNRVTCALTLQHPHLTIHSLHKLNAYLGFRLSLSLYIYLYLCLYSFSASAVKTLPTSCAGIFVFIFFCVYVDLFWEVSWHIAQKE